MPHDSASALTAAASPGWPGCQFSEQLLPPLQGGTARVARIHKLPSVGTEAASGVVTLEFGPELGSDRRALAVKAVEGVEGVTKVVSVDKH